MGIGLFCSAYVFTTQNQNYITEYRKIEQLLTRYQALYASKNNKHVDDYSLEFINYGRTQLVYVLTDNQTEQKVTILVKQPAVPFGKVKEEFNNLIELKSQDDKVVAPIDYFYYEDQELYVTPYINQARCVASDYEWGIYIPEPTYRFVCFTPKEEQIVNTCMIAKLISFYNKSKQEGIAACKLGGGDFMLAKGWEETKPTIENTLNNLYFIACREKVKCSLNEYIKIIKKEFSRNTIDENQENLIINHRGRVAMNPNDLDAGIQLGLELLHNNEMGE